MEQVSVQPLAALVLKPNIAEPFVQVILMNFSITGLL